MSLEQGPAPSLDRTKAERVVVLAPRGRDGVVTAEVLRKVGIVCVALDSMDALLKTLQEGAGAAVITDEALGAAEASRLGSWLGAQPVWSDFPIVRLATRSAPGIKQPRTQDLLGLGNVVILERPLSTQTLVSACRAAIRQRQRQYAAAATLQQLADARSEVEQANALLESRIRNRTRELAEANDRLTAEIAQRERTQAALAQAQKMEALGRLTGGIAHDFNNVLHAVSMNLEILERTTKEPKAAAVARRAVAVSRRGASLTSQLLAFARNRSLLPQDTDLVALIRGMQGLLSVSLGPSIRLSFELPDEPLRAMVDPTQLEMAILNLAVNSKDAMPNGGSLNISAMAHSRQGGRAEVTVSVADSGSGMPADLLEKVFEPFFTTKPLGHGTGLGLSQVYGLARQSGGTATLTSKEGSGTSVHIHLPMLDGVPLDAEAQPLDKHAATSSIASVPRRVLVVEDDRDVRHVLTESLRLLGHAIVEASNGAEALSLLEREEVDLMMVDYAMPGMTGAELIQSVRDRHGDIPTILATGYADMAEVGKVLYTQSVLLKPFTFHDLKRVLEAVTFDKGADALTSLHPVSRTS